MKLGELMALMSCKDGIDLYHKIEVILHSLNIDLCHEDGTDKSVYEICCDVAEVLNNKTK